MAAAAAVVSTVAKGVQTVSAVRQSRFEARVADRNASMERDAARDALDRGRVEEQRYERRVSAQMGAQRAALAANGIDIGFGSAAGFMADTARIGQEDAATIRENSMREVQGLEINASNFGAQASAARSRATGQLIGGILETGSTALGGAVQYRGIKARRAAGTI